jgi:uncharacterized protein YejL (UPF0352 family)
VHPSYENTRVRYLLTESNAVLNYRQPENIGLTPVSLGNVVANEVKVEDLSINDTIIA